MLWRLGAVEGLAAGVDLWPDEGARSGAPSPPPRRQR
jgi:hypothetical protein